MPSNTPQVGVVLMTYGSATTSAGVQAYLEHIYGQGKPSAELVKEFERRYNLVGRSPLIDITVAQAEALQATLPDGYLIKAGMLHSKPFIDQAVAELVAAGVQRIIGLILSPQFSAHIMSGYIKTLEEAADKHGLPPSSVKIVQPWPTEPQFIELLSHRLLQKRQQLAQTYADSISIIFTTHSLPKRVIDKDPGYLDQLQATAKAVVERAELQPGQWQAGYQSAGHTPEEWLKPDLLDLLKDLSQKGTQAVLIVPIQFLTDHLEIQYDLDIAAAEQCQVVGISYNRTDLPNTDHLFIQALTNLVLETSKVSTQALP